MDDAELVTSELVGNVVRHGKFPARLRIEWRGTRVRLEVIDASGALPAPRAGAFDDPGGLGLPIVAAVAQDWGAEPTSAGKVVWAELTVTNG